MAEKQMKLRVGELTDRDDFGRGIARIDSKLMNQIGVKEGDIIEVEGSRKSGAVAIRAYPVDIGMPLIRIDGLVRKNCGTGIGETVIMRKASVREARKVVLTPAERGVFLHISPNLLKQNLFMRPVIKGDIIAAVPAFRKTSESEEDFGEEPFGLDILSEIFNFPREVFFPFGTDMKLIAVESEPAGIVRITDDTHIEVLNEVNKGRIPGFSPAELRGLHEEAKEVKEIRQVPLVTYEDIGGIQDAVKKVREMIELPLRHPELFERLGVEPPKGVLLYGPPGTGKTLLAKAVANEAGAHFISLAGPEIMSKWYGQSLPYNEKIFLMEGDDIIKKKPIGEVVEGGKKENLKVLAFDEKGKVNFCKVTDLIKHKNNSRILEVKTRSGRKIKVTDYHSLFTLSGCKIKDIKTSELIPGKSFIAVPKTIPIFGKIEEIDFLESLRENDFGLKVRNIKKYVKEAREKIGYDRTASMLGYSKKYLSDVLSRNIGIPASKFLHLMKESKIDYNPDEIRIFTKGKSLSAKIKIDEDFCTFLGLWVAEGSFTQKGEVRLSLNENEATDIQKLVERLFGKSLLYKKKNTKGCDIYICSTVIGKFLKNVLSLKSGAKFKNVPEIIFNLDKSRMAAFLRGYFSGDGSIYPNQHGVPTIESSTVSSELADDLTYLLLHFGIVAKIYQKINDAGNLSHRICFTGVDNLKRFESIQFLDEKKNLVMDKFTQNVKWSRSPQIPMTPEINSLIMGSGNARQWAESGSIGINKLMEFTQDVPQEIMQGILNTDIYWDLVDEVVELPKEEYVYDISVEPCQNFVAGVGGIFAHNSEENLRKVFEEAQKNAPAIIFIDEIDAIAPKREEVTGEVERRVVSQLLTLMDGLKSRGKVIVLAATNRPNALDEALRRPGRFDREIDIGVPDKNGRKEILKIHTRNMPLSEDVNLDELSEKTYGYVGADLAALAREAAMSVIRRNMEEIKLKEEYLPKITEVSREYNIRNQKELLNAIKTVTEKLQKAEKDSGKAKSIFGKKSSMKEEEENGEQDETKKLSETLNALEIIKRLYVSMNDFNSAFLFVQPSAMREIMIEVPKVKWSDVGGLDEVKNALKEAVEWPLKNAESFKRLGIKPARGIMLYGPPGCGKTYIVKAVANEAGVNFIAVKGPEIMSKWVGESEENIRKIFRKAKQVSPSIIFFDEMDAIAPRRGQEAGNRVSEQTVSQILTEMSGIEDIESVAVIAASVTGDTPVMIKDKNGVRMVSISEFVDAYYVGGEEGTEKPVYGVKCLGFDEKNNISKFSSGLRFGKSNFKNVRGVFRHKVNEIFEIKFIGGTVCATGNHSVFVRTRKGIEAKPVSELNAGEFLVDMPYSARGKNIKDIRAHDFMKDFNLELPIFLPDINLEDDYDFSIKASMPQAAIASQIGFSQASVSNWCRNICLPRGLSKKYFKHALPEKITVSADLMRLFGYYVAEGYARKEIDFCFNSKERQLMDDVKGLMKRLFGIEPDAIRNSTENATNIVYYCKPLADFLGRHCGKGAHFKHVPPFLFTAPFEYFREFLKGYAAGDGHKDKKGRMEITSVSKQLITELNWLCRMHGIKSYISQFTAPDGRRIKGGKPLAAVKAYRLGFGKWSNPFSETFNPKTKRAKIKSIRKLPFNGYVYDLCGCENEAFFGGETPILLHNTNRPDIIDPALLRPGRFDKLIYVPAPDVETRRKIFEIHTKSVPLNVSKDEIKELNSLYKETTDKKETFDKIKNRIKSRLHSDEHVSKEEINLLEKGDEEIDLLDKENSKRQKVNFEELPDVEKLLYHLAEKTEGYSGADLEAVVREAALEAMRENMNAKEVNAKHFEEALKKIKPSITKDMFVRYQKAVEDLKKTKLEEEEKARYIG